MVNGTTRMHLMASRAAIRGQFRTAVCLHGHTQYSCESLGFISRILEMPIPAMLTRNARERYESTHHEKLNFARGYWTSPLSPRDAYELESDQIEESLELESLVSLTDHDSIEAGLSLQHLRREIPISLEWTLPYAPTYLHLGVHNLPPESAPQWLARLLSYTKRPNEAVLSELLYGLDEIPSVLLVLNHPLWEMEPIGTERVFSMVQSFLERFGRYIHALELSGLRPWKENVRVREMAEITGYTLVSGGDRHGWEPSAILNLTKACSFGEFVAEIREDRVSELAIMDQYEEPFNYRMLQVVCDLFREYPRHSGGKKKWTDRVFFGLPGSPVRPLSRCWAREEPRELKDLARLMRALENPSFQAALRFLLADGERPHV